MQYIQPHYSIYMYSPIYTVYNRPDIHQLCTVVVPPSVKPKRPSCEAILMIAIAQVAVSDDAMMLLPSYCCH
jgi:hypothetical protein